MTASLSLVRLDIVIIGAGTEGAVARLIATKPTKILLINFDYQVRVNTGITTKSSLVYALTAAIKQFFIASDNWRVLINHPDT